MTQKQIEALSATIHDALERIDMPRAGTHGYKKRRIEIAVVLTGEVARFIEIHLAQ